MINKKKSQIGNYWIRLCWFTFSFRIWKKKITIGYDIDKKRVKV